MHQTAIVDTDRNERAKLYVEPRRGTLYPYPAALDSTPLRVTSIDTLRGWGSSLDGPAVVVESRYYVPVREWVRIYRRAGLLTASLLLTLGLATTASAEPICRVNVNTTSQAELEALPKVGPVVAGRITAARPLADVAALDAVKGIGTKTLALVTPYVAFEGATDVSGCAELVKASQPISGT